MEDEEEVARRLKEEAAKRRAETDRAGNAAHSLHSMLADLDIAYFMVFAWIVVIREIVLSVIVGGSVLLGARRTMSPGRDSGG